MALAGIFDSRPELRRRRFDSRPAHRLGDQRRNIALNLEHIVDIIREAIERLVVAKKTACEIEWRQVFGARNHRPQPLAEQGFAADSDRVEIGAVNESQSDRVLCRPVA